MTDRTSIPPVAAPGSLRELEREDPFAPHDPGCRCWPHVSQRAAIEAAVQAAHREYMQCRADRAALRAESVAAPLTGYMPGMTHGTGGNALHAPPALDAARWTEEARKLIADAARIIETADNRAMAADGPVGHVRDEMSDAEWRKLYSDIEQALEAISTAATPASGEDR